MKTALNFLRPSKQPPASELRTKIVEAEERLAALSAEIDAGHRSRGDVLADAGVDELASLDETLRAKRHQADLLQTLLSTLRGRMSEAERKEEVAELEGALAAFEAESAAIAADIAEQYPKLAGAIVALATREAQLLSRRHALFERQETAKAAGLTLSRDYGLRPPTALLGGTMDFGTALRLPSANNMAAALWPPPPLNVPALLFQDIVHNPPDPEDLKPKRRFGGWGRTA